MPSNVAHRYDIEENFRTNEGEGIHSNQRTPRCWVDKNLVLYNYVCIYTYLAISIQIAIYL